MRKVLVFKGRRKAGSLPLEDGDYLVGRSVTCDLQLDDPVVSRTHATITVGDGGVFIKDEGTPAGMLVNDREVLRARLLAGDRVQIGPFTLVLSDDELGVGASMDLPTVADYQRPSLGEESTVKLSADELAELRGRQRTLMGAHLVCRVPGGEIIEFAMSDTTQTVGFTDDCEIRLPGSALFAKRVAQIAPDGSGWAIVASSSLAPVKVNGTKIDRKRLREGDMVEIKGVTLRYRGPIGAK